MEWIMYFIIGCAIVFAALVTFVVIGVITRMIKHMPTHVVKNLTSVLHTMQLIAVGFLSLVIGYAIVTSFI